MRWLAEFRTFARPERPEGAPPSIGDPVPDGLGPSPRLVVFLRHVGCPFAEATVRELELWRRRLPALPISIISQGGGVQSDVVTLESWLDAVGASGLSVRNDSALFDRWRVPVTSASHFLGPRSLASVVRLALQGIRNRHPSGSRWRSAAAFLVDAEGRVAWRHVPAHAGDLPDLNEAVSRLEALLTSGTPTERGAR